MSPKKKAKEAQAEVLGLEEIDKDDLMVCVECGSVFNIDIAEVCPRCEGKGLNPGPEKEEEDENFSPWDALGED